MDDGVGMTPENEGTETNTAAASDPRAGGDARGSRSDESTAVTSWSQGTRAESPGESPAESSGTQPASAAGRRTAGDQTGPLAAETDPAMADQPAEGGVEEAER